MSAPGEERNGTGHALIKIGIESTKTKLRRDILSHPDRYFFVLLLSGRATLCIRTCNSRGEDIRAQLIDGLVLDHDGNLISIFEEDLNDIVSEMEYRKPRTMDGEEYPLSPHIAWIISTLPDMIDWIISSLLNDDRNILINTSWEF
jgi:hypothetical protein